MKIGIFTPTFINNHSKSGISNAAYLIVKNLIEKYGCEIYVNTSKMDNYKNTEELENIRIMRFPCYTRYIFSPYMLNVHEKFDIVHSYHYGFFPAFSGLLTAKRTGAPHIFTPAYHPPIYTPLRAAILRTYDILQGFWLLKYSDTILPFNNDETNNLKKYVTGNYRIIPCPVNSNVFFPDRNERKKTTIGYVGPMLPWKGAKIAFDLFHRIEKERNDIRFVFIGTGQLENEIKLCAGTNFSFLKNLSPSELAKQYNSIDIIVSPTYYESFGCVLAEAGMCGTPVVSTKVGGVPETVRNGGLLSDYGNWKKMKENIEMLIDDTKLRKKLGRNAINHTKLFRDDMVAEKVYKVYRKVLNS